MRLKELRNQTNKTQTDIANYLNLTTGGYSSYETGKREPSIETLIKLADFYNVTVDYLLGREFSNDVGYLTAEEREYFEYFKQLSPINKVRIIGEMKGLLLGQ